MSTVEINQDQCIFNALNSLKIPYSDPLVFRAEELYSKLPFIIDSIDLVSHLKNNPRPNVKLSERRFKDYSLKFLSPGRFYPKGYVFDSTKDELFDIYLDTPVGIGLYYKGVPNAVTSFYPLDKDTFAIHQLQRYDRKEFDDDSGVKVKHPRGLMPLDWLKLLVEIDQEVAERLDYSDIVIKSGRDNSWTKPCLDGWVHLTIDDAERIYDDTARRLGYVYDPSVGWRRSIHRSS